MTTLFESSFDDPTFSDWDTELDFIAVTTPTVHGTYSACQDSPPVGVSTLLKTFTSTSSLVFTRFFIRFDNMVTGVARNIAKLYDVGGAGTNLWLYVDDSGSDTVFRIYNSILGNSALGTTVIENDRWYCIVLRAEISATATLELYVDGNLECSLSGNTSANGTYIDTIELDPNGYGLRWDQVYFDYLEVNTESLGCGIAPTRNVHVIEIRGNEKHFIRLHYIKNHPSPNPDTFDIRMTEEDADEINYWDAIDIRKDGVTEFYGFVEEKTPTVGEDGLEYVLTGRCWKVVPWKKQTERFTDTRDIGPVGESGFFGKVYPRELLMFFLRCPISIHPAGKIRHKIGWGIPSDAWVASAFRTNSGFYPAWAICRHVGFAWQNGTPVASEQQVGDYFQIDLGQAYNRVTSILIESRDDITETQYARNFEIQLSSDGVNWTVVRSFDGYGARDILASWAPVNNVRYIRIYITLTRTDMPNWEISQIYVWQTDEAYYRLLDEEETTL